MLILKKQVATLEKSMWQGIEGSPNQQPLGTESTSPATHKELNSANNYVSLEVNPSPVEP